jgi:23S rRNA (cytidine1920-2'-O)/16S rRNA (cytidine1409-2'-O)-methyltransferase
MPLRWLLRPGTCSAVNGKAGRSRLDQALVDKGLAPSRTRARALIMANKVRVDDQPCDKPGYRVDSHVRIDVRQADHPYVSRGGLKLEKALTTFSVDVTDRVCLDIGASTGGFTDCLLRFKAKHVYAVDVGYGQLAWSLRNDPRVTVIERTNIRYMAWEAIGSTMDLVVVDTAFISLKTVIPAAEKFMSAGTRVVALIKPQFEAGKQHVGKGGVVKDPDIRKQVVADLSGFFSDRGFDVQGVVPSPVQGPKGNTEYLIYLIFKQG